MKNNVFVIGAGGHAKVVISTLLELNMQIKAILDVDKNKWGKSIFNILVKKSLDFDEYGEYSGVIAVGNNLIRKSIANQMAKIGWTTIIHPNAYVHPSALIGEGSVIFAGAVVQPDVVIGRHCIINSNATIDHDSVVGDFAHIGPGSSLAGGVSVMEGAFLGIGSVAIVGKSIGKWSVVGAGGVITKNIPDNATAVGIPAKVVRHHNAT